MVRSVFGQSTELITGREGPKRQLMGGERDVDQELLDSVRAMLDWFGAHEPDRLENPGFQRLRRAYDGAVAAAETEAAALPDPDRPEVQLRAGASETEKLAALRAWPGSGTQRMAVLDAILAAGDDGLCDHEVEEQLGMNPSSVRPRRGELVTGGWVEQAGVQRLTPSGQEAEAWRATAAARRRLVAERRSA